MLEKNKYLGPAMKRMFVAWTGGLIVLCLSAFVMQTSLRSNAAGDNVGILFSPSAKQTAVDEEFTETIKAAPSAEMTVRGYRFNISFDPDLMQVKDIHYEKGEPVSSLADTNDTLEAVNTNGTIRVVSAISDKTGAILRKCSGAGSVNGVATAQVMQTQDIRTSAENPTETPTMTPTPTQTPDVTNTPTPTEPAGCGTVLLTVKFSALSTNAGNIVANSGAFYGLNDKNILNETPVMQGYVVLNGGLSPTAAVSGSPTPAPRNHSVCRNNQCVKVDCNSVQACNDKCKKDKDCAPTPTPTKKPTATPGPTSTPIPPTQDPSKICHSNDDCDSSPGGHNCYCDTGSGSCLRASSNPPDTTHYTCHVIGAGGGGGGNVGCANGTQPNCSSYPCQAGQSPEPECTSGGTWQCKCK